MTAETGKPIFTNDGLSSELLKKGLSSGNLQTALATPAPVASTTTAQPAPAPQDATKK